MEWRAVVGYEGAYEVSSSGRVRSLTREVIFANGRSRVVTGRELAPAILKSGYPAVNLWRNNKGRTRTVHGLVAEAFLGPRGEGVEVCHNDGNPANPNLSNLRYDTHQNNLMDTVYGGTNSKVQSRCKHGHLKKGENRIEYGVFLTRSKCRACTREHGLAYSQGRKFDPERANRNYEQMDMEGA